MAQSTFRFSIRTILIITGYTAVALVGLVHPSKAWVGVMYGITVVLLFYSIVAAIYQTERARAFWIGFALFGVGYLGLLFGPFAELSARLPTTHFLEFIREIFPASAGYPASNPYSGVPRPSGRRIGFTYVSNGIINYPLEEAFYFTEIGQAVFTLLFAVLGGVIGQYQCASRAVKETVEAAPDR